MTFSFDAFVVSTLFDRTGRAAFALGDGSVRFEDGSRSDAHPDSGVLSAAPHPSGTGVVTGGDDGRVVWSRAGEAPVELADLGGRWIDAVTTSAESGLIAFAAGKRVEVLDAKDPTFRRSFPHERSVGGVAFDAKGRRLACATYGGVTLLFARIADQKPAKLAWAGAHTAVAWSPDGKFLITAMQENALHGWRLADLKDLRMGGYPGKIRSMTFLSKGQLLATGGSHGAVVWPFAGSNGPMGKEAAEVGHDETAMVAQVAGAADRPLLAAGLDDGRVWVADLQATGLRRIRADKAAPVSALAMTPKGERLAWGDEDGNAAVVDLGA
jgi:WD40 repeat protein